jgi:hypothetical protein
LRVLTAIGVEGSMRKAKSALAEMKGREIGWCACFLSCFWRVRTCVILGQGIDQEKA